MPRHARVVPLHCPLHVTHRGNRRAPIFVEPGSQLRYLRLLQDEAGDLGLDVWAYCLMPNHVHLIVVASDPLSLARTMHRAHGQYAQWVNARQGWSGHLWAHRFYSAPMDDAHLWAAVRYVESNPVRAGLTARAEDYPWSSARAHAWKVADPLLAATRPFPGSISNWSAWLAREDDVSLEDEIRSGTAAGLPLGHEGFVSRLEQAHGRKLTPGRRGRPRPSSGVISSSGTKT
jgi:putative transposase